MYRIFLYLKRRGFTLAEILVATVIAGYCIMPIVGSMQGGIRHTENFNHREKLRMLARSRLNKELAAGAFDHSAINTQTTYHYVYKFPGEPSMLSCDSVLATDAASFTNDLGITFDDVVYSYKINVAVKENVNIATTSAVAINPSILGAPRGLKAIVVNAELLEGPYVIATDSISYFSLLTVPSFGDQFIWISNSTMLRILAVDSTTRAIAETFQMPLNPAKLSKPPEDTEHDAFRPWNIDLHPSRRLVGIQSKNDIKLLCIDKNLPALYQQTAGLVSVAAHPTAGIYADVKADASKAEEDRSIVFRPDGKYFFVTSHSNNYLYVYSIDVATSATLNWPPPVAVATYVNLTSDTTTNSAKHSDMIAGNDGFLYLSIKDRDNVIRFPMYPGSFTSGWTYEKLYQPMGTDDVNSTWTSKDGKYVYVIGDNQKVAQYRSKPLSKIGVGTFASEDKFRDIKLSHDSRYLLMTDKKDATGQGGLRGKLINEINFAANPGSIAMTRAYPGYKLKSDLAVLSPTGNEILFSHKDKPELYFVDIASLAAGVYDAAIPPDRILLFDSANKPSADIVTRVPEYMLVGAGATAADSTIEYFDLHTFKFDYDRSIYGLRNLPKTIGVSAQGTKFKVGYGIDTSGVDTYDMVKGAQISSNELSGNSMVVSYAADDETFYTATSTVATYSDNFFANFEMPGSAGSFNGYWIANPPAGSFGYSDIDTAWVPQDMKAMPNGGFLMLLKKGDGRTMLDWIGKIKWGADKGKYKRIARWINDCTILPTPMQTNSGVVDASSGGIYLLQNTNFSPGSRIIGVSFNSGLFGATERYITPVIVRVSSDSRTISDVGNSIIASESKVFRNIPIVWDKGGFISSKDEYVGWWNGNRGASNNAGVINLETVAGGLFASGYRLAGGLDLNPDDVSIGTNLASGPVSISRKYEIQFIGIGEDGNDFPPLYAQNIAISNCENFLAAETAGASGRPNLVYLYDFAKNNFGHETQLEGWIADYRVMNGSYWTFGNVANLCSFAVSNPTLSTGIKLKDSITSRENWTGYKSFPGNFANESVAGENLLTKRDANRRFFGYFQPDYNANTFSVYNRDHTRWFYNNLFIDKRNNDTSFGTLPAPLTASQTAYSISKVQIDYNTNGGNISQGIFTHTGYGQATDTVYAVGSNEAATVHMNGGWQSIGSASTRPFNFKPTLLRTYELTGCNGDSANAIAFSRDLANPILFVLDAGNDDFWALQPGKEITRITNGLSLDMADKQLVVSPDGQKLIFAEESGNNRIFVNDIGNPESFAFPGGTVTQSSLTGFGRLITTVSMNISPRTLAAQPFNSYKSTSKGKVIQVATLTEPLSGNNNAALSENGIYMMGGTHGLTTLPSDKIFLFNPTSSYSADIAPLTTTLSKAVRFNSVVSYANKIYSFNGRAGSAVASASDWVQKYDPVTDEMVTSIEPVFSGLPHYFHANLDMSASDKASYASTDARITYSGSIEGTNYAWKAFDHSISSGDIWSTYSSSDKWVQYDIGSDDTKFVVNSLWVNNAISYNGTYYRGAKNFTFSGSHDGSNWTILTTTPAVLTYNFAGEVEVANSTAYRYYRFKIIDNFGATYWGVREVELRMKNVRRVSPKGTPESTNYTASPKYATFADGSTVLWSSDDGSERGWEVFRGVEDGDNEWCTSTSMTQWLRLSLPAQEIVNILRITSEYDDGLPKNFTLYGTNNPANDHANIAAWTPLLTVTNNPHQTGWNHYYFNAANAPYQYYIIQFTDRWGGSDKYEIWGMELYSTQGGATVQEGKSMSKTSTDAGTDLKLSENAACMTPYGIVIAGGRMADGVTTASALVYWPHGLGKYENETTHTYGISRAIPTMPSGVYGHSLVWHKGKLYRIGGYTSGTTNATTTAIFDFDNNMWTSVNDNSSTLVAFAPDLSLTNLPRRAFAGVCSFGDEILIFGGLNGLISQNNVYAWNPETKFVRELLSLPQERSYTNAVPCGSSIYLIGGLTGANANAISYAVLKYTP